jgi:hypothetical protein
MLELGIWSFAKAFAHLDSCHFIDTLSRSV